MPVVPSLLLGALLGLANAVAAVFLARRGRTMDLNPAMALVLGGGLLRMLLLLVAVGLVLGFVSVHRLAFIGGLGALFAVGMIAEVVLFLGRPGPSASRPPADA